MIRLFRYFTIQQFSWLGFSIIFFLVTVIIRGNNERIGLGFISLNAIPAFLIILFGFRFKIDFSNSFTRICFAIIVFTLISFFVNGDTIIPLYSIIGNVALAFALVLGLTSKSTKMTIDGIALILAFVFLSYYFGFWSPYASDDVYVLGESRLSYIGINPNGVSELIALSVISFLFIFFRLYRKYRFPIYLYSFLLVAFSLLPLLLAASRKGFVLYLLCIFIFLAMKFRWYRIKRLFLVIILLVVGTTVLYLEFMRGNVNEATTLVNRFQGESFDVESDQRYFLIYQSFMKGMEKPFFGHGLESSRNPTFLKSIGLWNYEKKTPINSHNGFINIFLKGGFVFLILHVLLIFIPMHQLWYYIRKLPGDSDARDLLILSFLYIFIFLIHILSSGNGELFKLGWILLGFGVYQLLWVKRQLSIKY